MADDKEQPLPQHRGSVGAVNLVQEDEVQVQVEQVEVGNRQPTIQGQQQSALGNRQQAGTRQRQAVQGQQQQRTPGFPSTAGNTVDQNMASAQKEHQSHRMKWSFSRLDLAGGLSISPKMLTTPRLSLQLQAILGMLLQVCSRVGPPVLKSILSTLQSTQIIDLEEHASEELTGREKSLAEAIETLSGRVDTTTLFNDSWRDYGSQYSTRWSST
ncbi:hypothetical protein NQZ68_031289 [Dissostichus eleginoides]|nr:hypothetical protein NQZ68_031289 [Dissostichus eleginoides]